MQEIVYITFGVIAVWMLFNIIKLKQINNERRKRKN
jgi:uncharacterized membrane protein YuzA (DUF378 family)